MESFPSLTGYELVCELGGGSLTRVFAARHIEGEFTCAIKTLRPEWENDCVASQLIRREARIGLAVRHSNLIRLLGAEVMQKPNFIVMEQLDGETLRECLDRHGRFDFKTAIYVAHAVADALLTIHQAGFVHSDVKPANIWLGTCGEVKLMDLGFGHRPGEHADLMREGYLFGTPDYLAPELCCGDKNHTFASDWFSFGLVLAEMLTGELPYPAGETEAVLHSHEHMDIRFWIKLQAKSWPQRLGTLIELLLAKEPSARPSGRYVVSEMATMEVGIKQTRRAA
jgi:eukaryotic-like serine/threonine-protein kinase